MSVHAKMGRGIAAGLIAAALALGASPASAQDDTVTVALGDIASVETLNLLIALENARERGVDIELIEFGGEDIANQAVINGQADIGVGAPYAIMQRSNAPIRMFYQLSTLKFFVVANKEVYPDWKALEGGTIGVHTRGSGTEAMAKVIEQEQGISFGEISYVPGSEVRSLAVIRGNLDAAFVDIAGRNLVLAEGDKFVELPTPQVDATDEALFARLEWLQENEETVQIIVEELLKTWRQINQDPTFVVAERERLNLLPDLPAEVEEEVQPYFTEAVETGIFPNNGGGPENVQDDFQFYTTAGQLEGNASELKVEDFWYFAPLEKAIQTVGQ